ncbi:MAG: N-acetylglucosamine-6-phosphate deacetylase [Gemmatales bacterium]|nr:N-acetylglucosamine-6-phosphate deacetylase [Gemmatales bacterium]MDW7994703.1 N-acetylglucosamine-6-phosphate deacetylase [Gemmatales bacterium]
MLSMQGPRRLFRGRIVVANGLLEEGHVLTVGERIVSVGEGVGNSRHVDEVVEWAEGYVAPGFVDLHVHGGDGADFMDGTESAIITACRAHARHGTTSLLVTTCVAWKEQILTVLEHCRRLKNRPELTGCRILGVHLYGPYFASEARGCHPASPLRPPRPEEFTEYLEFADVIVTASFAPELPGAEAFAQACVQRGIRLNIGHSQATAEQVAQAIRWGARHVDHLFCAMSDKTKLRRYQSWPMRGGVLEATLLHDELTTEVIADGVHLSADLLSLAWKCKGVDRLALVTDCNRALDMPDGRYVFGPLQDGEPFQVTNGVALTLDGQGLASSVRGMDWMVRTFWQLTGRPVWEVIRMASQTPARIIGCQDQIGSLEPGKLADLILLDDELRVRQVYVNGQPLSGGNKHPA